MKKFVLLSSVLALTACNAYHNSKPTMQLNPTVKTNVEATINVGERVTGVSECKQILFFNLGAPKKQTYISDLNSKFGNIANDECTAGAVYDAVSKSNADILVSPQYTTAQNGFLCLSNNRCLLGKIKTIVTGWSGKISNIK